MSQKLPNPNHIHVVRMYTRQHPLISLIYNEVLEEYIQIIHFHRIFHEINYPAIRVPPLEETFSSSSRPGAQGSQGAKGVFFTSRQPEDGRLSLGISGTFPKENRPGDWTSGKKKLKPDVFHWGYDGYDTKDGWRMLNIVHKCWKPLTSHGSYTYEMTPTFWGLRQFWPPNRWFTQLIVCPILGNCKSCMDPCNIMPTCFFKLGIRIE